MQIENCDNLGSLTPVESLEVRTAIKLLNSGKAADIHGLKAEHIKYAADHISRYCTSMFNVILKSGTVPDAFQSAFVIPVHNQSTNALTISV